jgi:hypothetical protein
MPADRENRTKLDTDLEGFCLLAGVGEQIPGNDQMPCGRDRQKFGQTFDQAENYALDQRKNIHKNTPNRSAKSNQSGCINRKPVWQKKVEMKKSRLVNAVVTKKVFAKTQGPAISIGGLRMCVVATPASGPLLILEIPFSVKRLQSAGQVQS